jgi:hypothetical protein
MLVALATAGCGDDDADSGGSSSEWDCYDDPGFGQCDCYAIPPGDAYIPDEGVEMPVSSCPSYMLCLRYYDTFFEWDTCTCGPSDLMPTDAMDIQAVAACPPSG